MPSAIFDPSRCSPPSNATHTLAGVELRPGENWLAEAEIERLRADRVAGFYQDWGALTFPDPVDPPADPPAPPASPPAVQPTSSPPTPKKSRAKGKSS